MLHFPRGCYCTFSVPMYLQAEHKPAISIVIALGTVKINKCADVCHDRTNYVSCVSQYHLPS